MATTTHQYSRRGVNTYVTAPVTNTSTNGVLSRSSTGSVASPPRRYILDVPTGRTARSSRSMRTFHRVSDDYGEVYARDRSSGVPTTYSTVVTTGMNNGSGGRLSRSNSREFYYRDGSGESLTTNANRYYEDSSTRHVLESGTTYANTAVEDQEIQRLTAQATPDIKNYPINVDANPELIIRPNTQRLTYKQDIAVRYLKPSTPPPPGPIIIREIRAPAPPPAPPIILRQRPPPPRTPSPIIIREKPPSRPKSVPTTVIRKIIPPPPPPPRKLIIERLPTLPPKPNPIIIERWLPYRRQKRQVIHEKAKPLEPMARVKNTIIEWRSPEVEVVKYVKKLGVEEANPEQYYSRYGDKLYASEFVQQKLIELGLQEEIALIQEQQASAANEEITIEKADEYNVRQILDNYGSSSKQAYRSSADGTTVRLVRSSSHPGFVDEYGERQVLYNRSPNSSSAAVYEGSSYNFDRHASSAPILTEEMLLQSYSDNNGQFPTHLLAKLGSQVYDMPSDQVDLTNSARRTTTTTTTQYYSVNQGEAGYESAGETGESSYLKMRSSGLEEILPNYDVYSKTGQKLEGEQLNF